MEKQSATRRLVESALMIAIATVLSTIKFGGLWAFGGGVTLCSMVPLVMVSFRWGWKWGGFTAFVYSLLQILLGLDNVQYATGFGMAVAIVLLDYVLAYTVVGFTSVFKNRFAKERLAIVVGVAVTLGLRLVCHFFSGWMIWDALWPNELGMASAVYSLWYNASYMLPEIVLTAGVCCLLIPWSEKALSK